MATSTVPHAKPHTTFKPFVPATESRPEMTVRAILIGAIFGVLFGAVTVYVGLKAGLTVAASIPISVLSISILRAFGKASRANRAMRGLLNGQAHASQPRPDLASRSRLPGNAQQAARRRQSARVAG